MMNKNDILKKAGGILTELNEQYQYLSQSPDNLNELELELLSANAKFLSDHLSILLKLNRSPANSTDTVNAEPPENKKDPEPEEPEPTKQMAGEKDKVEIESDWKFELEKEPGLTFEFEEKQADKLFDGPLTEEEKRVIDQKTTIKVSDRKELEDEYIDFEDEVDDEIEEVQIHDSEAPDDDVYVKEVLISERTIAVPVPSENPIPTVNDLLSKNISPQTIASQFNTRHQKDLKGMISLNDKLLFVRELFNGYSLAYSEALELLNRFDNFEAADNFLKQNYAPKNNWAQKQDVTDKFYEILNRRFSK